MHLSIIEPGKEEPELDFKELFESDEEDLVRNALQQRKTRHIARRKRRCQFKNVQRNFELSLWMH